MWGRAEQISEPLPGAERWTADSGKWCWLCAGVMGRGGMWKWGEVAQMVRMPGGLRTIQRVQVQGLTVCFSGILKVRYGVSAVASPLPRMQKQGSWSR